MAVKYVALDLHQASTSISIRDTRGRVIRREVVPTSAARILEVIDSAGGSVHVTLEEGTLSQWIYDQLVSHVARVIVCDPRHNRLLAAGNKSDRIDADKLSDLLRLGALRSVYHERSVVSALRELVRSYNTLVEDSTRVMLRVKAIFRARAQTVSKLRTPLRLVALTKGKTAEVRCTVAIRNRSGHLGALVAIDTSGPFRFKVR